MQERWERRGRREQRREARDTAAGDFRAADSHALQTKGQEKAEVCVCVSLLGWVVRGFL